MKLMRLLFCKLRRIVPHKYHQKTNPILSSKKPPKKLSSPFLSPLKKTKFPQEITTSSPPPISPLSTTSFPPRSTPPESPPLMFKIIVEGTILITKPTLPIKPETSPLFVDYLLVREEMTELHLNDMMKMVINPNHI